MKSSKAIDSKKRKKIPKHLSHTIDTIEVAKVPLADASPKLTQKIKLKIKFTYEDWLEHAEFDLLYRIDLTGLDETKRTRFLDKRDAAIAKWTLIHISGAELCALCGWVCKHYDSIIPTPVQKYLTIQFESFLTISRSFLDILASALSLALLKKQLQSFNDLRKNTHIPNWLRDYAKQEMHHGPDISLTKSGWLSLLLSGSDHDQCLRDFVTHRGVADFCFSEDDDRYELAIKPPRGAAYLFSVKKIVQKIFEGLTTLNCTLIANMKDKLVSEPVDADHVSEL